MAGYQVDIPCCYWLLTFAHMLLSLISAVLVAFIDTLEST